ncbi:methyl-accepting chemotaxis protein [Devosia beringensis]|uniref:methyl-accepting chemotaxis protein n=1 Tax=Devosia beringensis TaxID=2657486 RepID=UPI001E565561|nr:methyl-accepting chemotaxis protein [Devosia beringensis]
MKLTKTIYGAGGILVAVAVAGTIANFFIAGAAHEGARLAQQDAVASLTASQQITAAIYDIKIDIVQVQQWLTDVSATRGLDGLNDGYDQAKKFADRLPDDVARAKALATDLGQDGLVVTLDTISTQFAPYYAAGQKMADAYVAGGPEQGNTMMGQFDETASAVGASVDAMVAALDILNEEIQGTLRVEDDAAAQLQQISTWLDFASHLVAVLGIVGLLAFVVDKFRRLRDVAFVATEIAGGNLDAPRLGKSKWDELAAVFKAIGVFRDQGHELNAFKEDTARQLLVAADSNGQIDAIGKSQAVVAFDTQGVILGANKNFLDTVGYRLDEIVGKHHSMFLAAEDGRAPDYAAFWERLRQGTFDQGEYRRISKTGEVIWLQASYNPILDPGGRVTKIVKYASDITKRKQVVTLLTASLERLAEGDLDARIETVFRADFEPVREALNSTVDRLTSIIGQLRNTSGSLKTATSEILSGANDLSDRTTKQAAAIEETSASMEQLAATVNANAKRAEQANGRTKSVAQTADDTGEVMSQATGAMEKITSSSAKISNIIGLIDDIAFQTNLLALNASVEAARAGDAGKGFAVVAVEVRRLAQSAASASSDVKKLIDESAVEVSSGSRLVAEASTKLSLMVDGVRESASLVQAIAEATHEQSNAIAEVSTAIREMDEMTQHNAALVEQTNAAIEQTEAQAADLDRVVDVFVLPGQTRGSRGMVAHPIPSPSKANTPRQMTSRTLQTHGNAAVKQDWAEF